MDVWAIGLLVGAAFILVGIVGGGLTVKEIQIPAIPTGARIACVAAGVLFIGLPFLYDNTRDGNELSDVLTGTRPTSTSEPLRDFEITIDSPQEGDEVLPDLTTSGLLRVTLEGTLRPAVATGVLWIVSQDEGGDYYLQGQFSPAPKENWTEPLIFGPVWYCQDASVLIIETVEVAAKEIGKRIDLPSDTETVADTHFTFIDPDGC